MALTRHFLGWDRPVVDCVRDFLLDGRGLAAPVDFEDMLIVVPTVQAGRRLRESLARACAEQDTTLLSARTVTPAWFLHTHVPEDRRLATATLTRAIWADVVRQADPAAHRAFFGARTTPPDDAWAMQAGNMLHELRILLSDAGLSIGGVPEAAGAALEELDRWQHMGLLEAEYRKRLDALALIDACDQARLCADLPDLPDEVTRIVICSIPSPSPLSLEALEHLVDRASVEVLVHAPDDRAGSFTDWGVPLREEWFDAPISVPCFEENVILAGSPESQAEAALALMATADDLGPADIAIGVPDRTVLPSVSSALADHNIDAFDPAEPTVGSHPVFGLISALFELHQSRSYESFASLVRHPDMLLFLTGLADRCARDVLRDLDRFQNEHLPLEWDDIAAAFPRETDSFPALAPAVDFLAGQRQALQKDGPTVALRQFLCAVFASQEVVDGNPEHEELKRVADAVDRTLRELAGAAEQLPLSTPQGCALLLDALSTQTFAQERGDAMVDLEGWLELPWNDAPFLIVTGMNEGIVPETRLGDVFIPDSLRQALGLIDDEARMARDAYLMSALVASREAEGRVAFIVGKTSAAGDPLKPSRLFFRCDDELVDRADILFGDPGEREKNHPYQISFKLDPTPPADLPVERLSITHMSPTRFRSYLACPFRFYLRYVLRMEELDDSKAGMDALDFGNLVHHALEQLGKDEDLRTCEDSAAVAAFLKAEAEGWVHERFGSNPPLPVTILLESARQRLAAAASVHVDHVGQGWEMLDASERDLAIEDFGGVSLMGRIDRIDRHRDSGAVRVIDYKTTDAGTDPAKAHCRKARDTDLSIARTPATVKGKEAVLTWIDLQLPLYRTLVEANGMTGPVEVAYFNMPKAVSETAIQVWDTLDDELYDAACSCARRVVEAVRGGTFWPPAEATPKYDDFEALGFGAMPDFVDGDNLDAALRKLTGQGKGGAA